ncbi:MAG: lipopolysaccharide biosynthesis protein [Pikeienuella sp.]
MTQNNSSPNEPATGGGGMRAIFRRIGRNAGMLFGGRVAFGLLNLGSSILAVRAVGLEGFGVIILLQAYVRLISGLLKFQSWAAVTKFGADALQAGRNDDFRRLIGFTLRLDMLGLAISVGLAMLAAPYAAPWLGWTDAVAGFAIWFALTIPFITAATATGMLRLFDRFGVLVRQHALNAIVRFIGVVFIFFAGLGYEALILAWAAGSVVSGTYIWYVALSEAHARKLSPRLWGRWSKLSKGFPNIWRFVVVMNLTSLMETILMHATVLVVGGMLGPSAAGLFGVVKQLTESLSRFSSLLGPVVFPEFAWLEAKGDRRAISKLLWRMLLISSGILGAFCLFLVFASEWVLLVFAKEAVVAAPLLVAMGVGSALMALGFALEPAMLTIRKERALLFSAVISTILFCGMLFLFIEQFGLVGAGGAIAARQGMIFLHRIFIMWRVLVLRPRRVH